MEEWFRVSVRVRIITYFVHAYKGEVLVCNFVLFFQDLELRVACCLQLCCNVFHLCSLVPMSSESESTSCEPSGPKSPPIKPG